jgi:hypothetical protein
MCRPHHADERAMCVKATRSRPCSPTLVARRAIAVCSVHTYDAGIRSIERR